MGATPTTGLRGLAARGTLVNASFQVGLSTLGLLKGFAVAAFLTREQYGVWGVLAVVLGTLLWLKQAGIGDKYVQQEDPDQERAFQRAFTLELAFSGIFLVALVALTPLMVLAYGEPKLLLPGLAISLNVLLVALQAAIWPWYRAMDFLRQRLLLSVDPVVTFAVTVALAAAGLGYWSLVAGALIGSAAGAAVALRACPYRLALRWDGAVLRAYVRFSGPLVLAGASGIVIAQASTLVADWKLGLSGVGAVALASSIVAYAARVDEVVTAALYPAICRRVERLDLLREAFLKSNRAAMLWSVPCGIGLALFARPFLGDVLGERWLPAVGILQAFALVAAANQFGFNWDAFYRARGQTRPIAVASIAMAVVFLVVAIPLLVVDGLDGLGLGMAVTAAVGLAVRVHYLRALFGRLPLVRHALSGLAPTLPALGAVLALRLADVPVVPQVVAFAVVVIAATWALERPLLRELLGYARDGGLLRPTSAINEPATRPV